MNEKLFHFKPRPESDSEISPSALWKLQCTGSTSSDIKLRSTWDPCFNSTHGSVSTWAREKHVPLLQDKSFWLRNDKVKNKSKLLTRQHGDETRKLQWALLGVALCHLPLPQVPDLYLCVSQAEQQRSEVHAQTPYTAKKREQHAFESPPRSPVWLGLGTQVRQGRLSLQRPSKTRVSGACVESFGASFGKRASIGS